MCFAPQRRALFRHLNFQKTSFSTSKSGPNVVCFVHFDFEMCFAPQRRFFEHLKLPKALLRLRLLYAHFDFEMCFVATTERALFQHLNFQKWSETWCALYILTSKCASRHNGVHFFEHLSFQKRSEAECALHILTSKSASCHNGVHFFNISTSKSGPNVVCFVHFDLETCFAPQRRAIFHLSSGQLAPHPPL